MNEIKSSRFVAKRLPVFIATILVALSTCVLSACGSNADSNPESSVSSTKSIVVSTTSSQSANVSNGSSSGDADISVDENGEYTSKSEVAAYIHVYGHLPSNFISKTKARNAGWDSSKGNLQDVCPGKSIGGSRFYDDDDQLPKASGRTWTECDIDYHGGYRGSKRIIFSNDGLIFYTEDHYKTFEQLY